MTTKDLLAVGVVLSAKDMYHGIFDRAKRDLRSLNADAKVQAQQFERSLNFGKTLTMAGAAVTAGAFAISRALEGIQQGAMDLDQAVADVSTVMTNLERRPEFLAVALETSSKSMFNASQILREGAYNLLSAGLTEEEALAIIPRLSQLAVGTFDSIAGATNNATTVMMSYKSAWKDMSAEEKAIRTTDALARAIQLFKYVGPELAGTLQYTGAAAAAANVPLEDMLAVIGVMKSAGLEASMAGTSYRMMLEKLPSVQRKTGIATSDAAGRMRPMVEILIDLKKRYGDVLDMAELEEISKLFDVRAAGGVKALLMNLDELEKKTKEMNKSGAAFEMYERRMAGAGAQMKALKDEYAEASAVLAMKMLPVMRTKQELLTKAVKTMERIPGAKYALLFVDIAAEIGKIAGPLATVVGLAVAWNAQRKIADLLEKQLQLQLVKTATVGSTGNIGTVIGANAAKSMKTGMIFGAVEIAAALMGAIAGWKTSEALHNWRKEHPVYNDAVYETEQRRARHPWEVPVPEQWRGGPLTPEEKGLMPEVERIASRSIPFGPPTLVIENMTIQGTGNLRRDGNEVGEGLMEAYGKWLEREMRRHPR